MSDGNGEAGVRSFDAVVIGAGFGGLYALHKLREIGLDVRGIESAADVGGVWFWNRYPGARVDSESNLYSYGFSEELLAEWRWSKKYCFQPEILDYLSHVSDRFDLRALIDFETKVVSAAYDEDDKRWSLHLGNGDTVRTRFLVTAVGCYSAPHRPRFAGQETFEGEILYTFEWPETPPDLSGKRVGIIGTGSTGVQVITAVAPLVKELTVFQRTANWVLPVWNRPADPAQQEQFMRDYPQIREECNSSPSGFPYAALADSVEQTPPERRAEIFSALWSRGGIEFLSGTFSDYLTNAASNAIAADYVGERMREQIDDPDLARRLIPTDHPVFSKRPPMEDDYLRTFNRPNVSLVDVKADPIVAFTARGLRTAERAFELDTVIMATGFDSITGALLAIDFTGRNGAKLASEWAEGPETYLGLGISNFPNLFTITGPLSPSVLVNTPLHIEQQVDWIADLILHMNANNIAAVEPSREAQQEWVAHSDAVSNALLFKDAASSYKGDNIPGKPQKFAVYAGGFAAYRGFCNQEARDGYRNFVVS